MLKSIFLCSISVSPNLRKLSVWKYEKLGLVSLQKGFFCPFEDGFPEAASSLVSLIPAPNQKVILI